MSNQKNAQLRRKWKRWLERIEVELTELLISRHIFEGVREIVLDNKSIQSPGDVMNWMAKNYAHTTAIGIRKLMDPSRDPKKPSVSMFRLLEEIKKDHKAMTRKSHVHWYRKGIKHVGEAFFDEVAGAGAASLPSSVAKTDLKKLSQAERRIRVFVNKRVAHLDQKNTRRKAPTFGELRDVLPILEETYRKYKLLLTAHCSNPLLPIWTYDWKEVFYRPWIENPPFRLSDNGSF